MMNGRKVLKDYVKPNIDTKDKYYYGWQDLDGWVYEEKGQYVWYPLHT